MFRLTTVLLHLLPYLRDEPHPHYTSSSTAKRKPDRIFFQAFIFKDKLADSFREGLPATRASLTFLTFFFFHGGNLGLRRLADLATPFTRFFPPEVPKNNCFKWSKTESIA